MVALHMRTHEIAFNDKKVVVCSDLINVFLQHGCSTAHVEYMNNTHLILLVSEI